MLHVVESAKPALPCRISVYEDGGKTKLATIKPTAMIALYPIGK